MPESSSQGFVFGFVLQWALADDIIPNHKLTFRSQRHFALGSADFSHEEEERAAAFILRKTITERQEGVKILSQKCLPGKTSWELQIPPSVSACRLHPNHVACRMQPFY